MAYIHLTQGDPLAQAHRTAPQHWAARSFQMLYAYLFCVLASTVLTQQSVLGGAMYMAGQTTRMVIHLYRPAQRSMLNRAQRIALLVLAVVSGLISLTILLIYPRKVDLPLLWLLFSLVLLISLQATAVRHLWLASAARGLTRVQRALRTAEVSLLFVGICALILFVSLPTQKAWYLLGGFVLASLLGMLDSESLATTAFTPTLEEPALTVQALDQVQLFTRFRTLNMIIVTALQVTMILVFTFIALSATELFLCMGLAFVFTNLSSRLTRALLMRPRTKERDASTTLLTGLALWIIGLLAFSLHLNRHNTVLSYVAVATCTAGSTVAVISLDTISRQMDAVVAFALNRPQANGSQAMHALLSEFAAMVGQLIALIGLTLVLLFAGPAPAPLSLQPALLLPALILVAAALPPALVFPLTSRYSKKLNTFLMLRENGETNVPLQKQLEDVILRVSRRRYGIKLLMMVLRPFFYNKVMGRENVRISRDTCAIMVCNHGELYGPIVTNLYVPFSFRPWVVSEMVDPEQISDYIYRYTIKRQKWLPEAFKKPVADFCAPVLAWIMRSLESIPVYRDQPRALIQTFRDTVTAMEAGDNILLFPENPNDPNQAQRGYLRDSVGEFYTGFTMLAQLYHQKTGKIVQFIPIYADKKKRTLSFGPAIYYNPDNHPAEEKQRIVTYLRNQMLEMGGFTSEDVPDDKETGA